MRTKMVDGIPVPMSVAEEAQRDAEEAAFAASQLPAERGLSLMAIDLKAGAVRMRYITSVAGQEATYILKERQAEKFKADGYAGNVPALVKAEAEATGRTATQAADAILAERDAWIGKAAQIEKARRVGKLAVAAAADVAAVKAARTAALAALDAL